MSYFNSYYLFIVLPIIFLIYNLIPKKRNVFLFIINLLFFVFISRQYVIFLLITIISVFLTAKKISLIDSEKEKILLKKKIDKKEIEKEYKRKKKKFLVLCIILNFSFLFVFKYLVFFFENINLLFDFLNLDANLKIIKFISPIGISFYTLTAFSYLLDVYNGKIKASNSFLEVALFISYFPQIIEGPMTRFSDTAHDLYTCKKITYKNLCYGYQRILYGFFKKKIIADRMNILVDLVFTNYTSYSGFSTFLGAMVYTIMLYMEFSGTMDIVMGTSNVFGINMCENFRQPFFSKNISEFWTRWHISLGLWFKDYIYYPISLSKPLKKLTVKLRHKVGNYYGPVLSGGIALFVVWFLNGLWHGAGYTYLFFGMYHFILILIGNLFNPVITNICKKLKINRENIFYRIFQSVKVAILVFFGELFFRAPSMSVGIYMFKQILFNFKINKSELFNLGLDIWDLIILFISLGLVLVLSLMKENGIDVRNKISKKKIYVRWLIWYTIIFFIILFGAYGPGYVPLDPIYADF